MKRAAALLLLASTAAAQEIADRLPDFSWAGYRSGEAPLPAVEPTLDVRDFGAKGDGTADDTEAFRGALAAAAAKGEAVAVPEGRWVVSGVLTIGASGVRLKGAGAGKTVLVCPKSLADMHGAKPGWSWSGGMIEVKPAGGAAVRLGGIARAKAGERQVEIRLEPGVEGPRAGEWIELAWHNDRGKDTLLDHLYGGVVPRERMGRELQEAEGPRVREWVQVDSVDGTAVGLSQPLSLEIRPEWAVSATRTPSIRGVGIEGLTFEFPGTAYPGHLKESGYNAIDMSAAIDCWVRDVETVDADSGIFVGRCKRVTVDGFRARGRTMHHALSASWSSDCLFTGWRIEAPHVHGTTISWGAHRNVFSGGWGNDLAMDAHRAASFENLHTDITIDWGASPTSPFRSGGSFPRGPHAARGNVYWNVEIRAAGGRGALKIPAQPEWPLGVFVGWHGTRPVEFPEAPGLRQAFEGTDEVPAIEDLHRHQLKKRLGR